MYFNYKKEKEKFISDWAQEEKLLRSQNVSEEIIEEIYRFSLDQFRANRNYYLHKEEFSTENDLSEDIDLDIYLEFLEQIENAELCKVLQGLSSKELKILILSYIKKFTHSEIAEMLHCSRTNVTHCLSKIKKLIINKNIF